MIEGPHTDKEPGITSGCGQPVGLSRPKPFMRASPSTLLLAKATSTSASRVPNIEPTRAMGSTWRAPTPCGQGPVAGSAMKV